MVPWLTIFVFFTIHLGRCITPGNFAVLDLGSDKPFVQIIVEGSCEAISTSQNVIVINQLAAGTPVFVKLTCSAGGSPTLSEFSDDTCTTASSSPILQSSFTADCSNGVNKPADTLTLPSYLDPGCSVTSTQSPAPITAPPFSFMINSCVNASLFPANNAGFTTSIGGASIQSFKYTSSCSGLSLLSYTALNCAGNPTTTPKVTTTCSSQRTITLGQDSVSFHMKTPICTTTTTTTTPQPGVTTTTIAPLPPANYVLLKLRLDKQEIPWVLPTGQCMLANLMIFKDEGGYIFRCNSDGTPKLEFYSSNTCTGTMTDKTSSLVPGNWRCGRENAFSLLRWCGAIKVNLPMANRACLERQQFVNSGVARVGNAIPVNGSVRFQMACVNGTVASPNYNEVFRVITYTQPNCSGTPMTKAQVDAALRAANIPSSDGVAILLSVNIEKKRCNTLFQSGTIGAVTADIAESDRCYSNVTTTTTTTSTKAPGASTTTTQAASINSVRQQTCTVLVVVVAFVNVRLL